MTVPHPLEDFATPKAKIDFITIPLYALKTEEDVKRFQREISGRIAHPSVLRDDMSDFLTIHDPTVKDLQYLLDEFHDVELRALEIAVDFMLKDGSNSIDRLNKLHEHFKKCMFPQRHDKMKNLKKRKFYDRVTEKVIPDSLSGASSHTTNYWSNSFGTEQVRMYVKTLDNGKPVKQYSVRIEVTLYRGGCQNIYIHRVGLLPSFIPSIRQYLSPYFTVAKGIKPKIKRSRSTDPQRVMKATRKADKESARVGRNWERYGALWAAKYDYKVVPDTAVTRPIGVALKMLRETLKPLHLPAKVADPVRWVEKQQSIYQGIDEPAPPAL